MLDKKGLTYDNGMVTAIKISSSCYTAIQHCTTPQYGLVNNLYCGCLSEQYNDITWVEEMVCAIYRSTAHVTRIYQSSDPAQPKVFHGNTCAHDLNVVSTASVLPRTPADVAGMLTVVFIGPHKFKPEYVGNMYHVRKRKIWSFLLWLKSYNKLYKHMTFDLSALDMYPEDDVLPGLSSRIVEDHR
ncbi:hypothetical protein BKA93DRAFT_708124, partial [Sparassis latifolia]